MQEPSVDRKAAAEARRAKLLARGGDRLAQITGSLHPAAPVADPAQDGTPPTASAPAEPATEPPPPSLPPDPPAHTVEPAQPAASLAADMGAALHSRGGSAASLPQLQQQAKGTATNGKWARYEAPGGAAQRPKRTLRRVSVGETLSAAVLSTGRLRLLLAALLAVLLAARWDAAAMGSSGALSQPSAPPLAPSSPWAELGARVQGLLDQARAAVLPQKRAQAKQAQAAQPWQQLSAGLSAKLRGQLSTATATPAGRAVAAAAQRLRRLLSTAAASATGQQAAAAATALQSALAAACGTPAFQRIRAALGQLPAAGDMLRQLRLHLAAVVAAPLTQSALEAAERLPPLAAVALLGISVVGAAAAGLAAAPGLVHGKLELDLQSPGPVARLLAGLLPGLSRRLSLLAAGQRLAQGLLDDAAAFLVALLTYHHLPQLAAAAQQWLLS